MSKFYAARIRHGIALVGIAVIIGACQVPSKPLPLSDLPSAPQTDQAIRVESKESTSVITPAAPTDELKMPSPTPESTAPNKDAQANLFADIAKVLQHPRCLICHVSGDTPKQGDDRHDHMPPAQRGAVPTLLVMTVIRRPTVATLCFLCMKNPSLDVGRICYRRVLAVPQRFVEKSYSVCRGHL